MRQVLLTVDVEALPSRAERDHVARLVFGRFAGYPPMGLREMMTEAEKRSMRLTCFFDYCEYDLYGSVFLDVAKEIAARGHELQLHAHPEVMKPETWAHLGLAKPAGSLDGFSDLEADRLFDWLLGLHGSVCGTAPVAFRGGGYRYSTSVLAAMRRHGLSVSSNHNPGRQNQLDARDSCEVFRHANGVLEVPISVLYRDGVRFEFNFNQHGFANSVDWFADAFWNRYGDRSILNLVMHSRSFLVMDARKRFYVPKDAQLLALFRSVLDRLQDWQTEAVGIVQWAEARNATFAEGEGQGKADDSPALRQRSSATATPQAASGAQMHEANRLPRPEPGTALSPVPAARPACPVCGDAKRLFVDFNGRRLARCVSCAALERQRSLVQAWNTNLRHDVPTEDRKALLVSPAKSERMIFAALGLGSLQTLDIRPEARCDIVADLCSMPQVQDGSFDLVFASHVLPHVHDLDAALSEIARILTPDGVFLSFTPVRAGQPTTVVEGTTQASGWYGADVMQKHQVGSFRSFGDLGLLRDLQRHFVVKTAIGEDPVTGRLFMWACAWKLSAADRVRILPKEGRRYCRLQRA